MTTNPYFLSKGSHQNAADGRCDGVGRVPRWRGAL